MGWRGKKNRSVHASEGPPAKKGSAHPSRAGLVTSLGSPWNSAARGLQACSGSPAQPPSVGLLAATPGKFTTRERGKEGVCPIMSSSASFSILERSTTLATTIPSTCLGFDSAREMQFRVFCRQRPIIGRGRNWAISPKTSTPAHDGCQK